MNLISIDHTRALIAECVWVLDSRPSAFFVQGMIPQSVHIPNTNNFLEYAELLLEPELKLVLLTEPGQETAVSRNLIKTGFATVVGIIDGGYDAWIAAGGKMTSS